jgi:hypothetical protein
MSDLSMELQIALIKEAGRSANSFALAELEAPHKPSRQFSFRKTYMKEFDIIYSDLVKYFTAVKT